MTFISGSRIAETRHNDARCLEVFSFNRGHQHGVTVVAMDTNRLYSISVFCQPCSRLAVEVAVPVRKVDATPNVVSSLPSRSSWRSCTTVQLKRASDRLLSACHAVLMADCPKLWVRGSLGKAALAHKRLHSWQIDTCSRCRPHSRRSLNFLHRHAGFLQIWRCDAVDAFPDRSLEKDPSPTGSMQWRLRLESRRRAPDNEPQYSVLIAAVLFECQLFLPVERCSSPPDNV